MLVNYNHTQQTCPPVLIHFLLEGWMGSVYDSRRTWVMLAEHRGSHTPQTHSNNATPHTLKSESLPSKGGEKISTSLFGFIKLYRRILKATNDMEKKSFYLPAIIEEGGKERAQTKNIASQRPSNQGHLYCGGRKQLISNR